MHSLSSIFASSADMRLKQAKKEAMDAKAAAHTADALLHTEAQIRLWKEVKKCQDLTMEIERYGEGSITFTNDYSDERNFNFLVGAAAFLLFSIMVASSVIIHLTSHGFWGPLGEHDATTQIYTVADRILLGCIPPITISTMLLVLAVAGLKWPTLLQGAKGIRLSFAEIAESANAETKQAGQNSSVTRVDWTSGPITGTKAIEFLKQRKNSKEAEAIALEKRGPTPGSTPGQTVVNLKS